MIKKEEIYENLRMLQCNINYQTYYVISLLLEQEKRSANLQTVADDFKKSIEKHKEKVEKTLGLGPSDKLVEHPKHYNSHPSGIECITIVQHYNFNIGSAMKYLWRQGLKDSEPSVRDLSKAIEYIKFEIERIQKSPTSSPDSSTQKSDGG